SRRRNARGGPYLGGCRSGAHHGSGGRRAPGLVDRCNDSPGSQPCVAELSIFLARARGCAFQGHMTKYKSRLNVEQLVAIDVHTHANISSRQPRDPCTVLFDEAMAKYFKSALPPTIPEVAQYYRERRIAAVIFAVDCEAEMGHSRIANEEV